MASASETESAGLALADPIDEAEEGSTVAEAAEVLEEAHRALVDELEAKR